MGGFVSIKKLAAYSVDRVKRGKDVAIAITGVEGDGKSALGIGFGLEADPFFSLERNVLFSPTVKEMTDKIYGLPAGTVVLADEAIKIMYKLNWTSKKQKRLNQIYTVCRNQQKISIFCIPRLTDLNEFFRNHRIRCWIHVVDPISKEKQLGHAVIMFRSWNPVTTDPWGIKVLERLLAQGSKKKKDAEYDLDDKLEVFEQLPTYFGYTKFGWVDSGLWKKYEALKEEANEYSGDSLEEDEVEKELLAWQKRTVQSVKVFLGLGYSKRQVAKMFDVSTRTVSSWLAREERDKVKALVNQPA